MNVYAVSVMYQPDHSKIRHRLYTWRAESKEDAIGKTLAALGPVKNLMDELSILTASLLHDAEVDDSSKEA